MHEWTLFSKKSSPGLCYLLNSSGHTNSLNISLFSEIDKTGWTCTSDRCWVRWSRKTFQLKMLQTGEVKTSRISQRTTDAFKEDVQRRTEAFKNNMAFLFTIIKTTTPVRVHAKPLLCQHSWTLCRGRSVIGGPLCWSCSFQSAVKLKCYEEKDIRALLAEL